MIPRWVSTFGLACLITFLLQTALLAQNRQTLIDALADNPAWSIPSEPRHFVDESIREILGDASELTRDYEVIGISEFLVSRIDSETEVGITLFEMFDSTAAFGLFSLERNQPNVGVTTTVMGAESYRQEERVIFWQSNFIVTLSGPSESTEIIATLLTDNIFGSSRKPPVSMFLPRNGLIAHSEKYILTPEAFEQTTGINPNRLGFENSAEATVAEYESADGSTMLLAMLLYPTQHLASLHLDAWLEDTPIEHPNRRSGPLLAIAVDSNDDALTELVLDAVRYESDVTWNEPFPDALTVPYLILTIFTWIGIALGFTLVVGLGYGGYRIYMKTRYQDRFLGHNPKEELIQLNINQQVTNKILKE